MTGKGMIERSGVTDLRDDRDIQGIHPPPSFPKFSIGNPKVFTEGGRFNKAVPNGVIEKVGEV